MTQGLSIIADVSGSALILSLSKDGRTVSEGDSGKGHALCLDNRMTLHSHQGLSKVIV